MKQKDVALLLIETLQDIRENIDPEMQLQTLLTFLTAAAEPGITMQDAMLKLKISQSSVSRNVDTLSVRGHGLLNTYEDPEMRRRKITRLTPKGEDVMKQIALTVNSAMSRIERRQS